MMSFSLLQTVHLFQLQNIPTEWTKYLFVLSGVAAVIRWFIEWHLADYQLVYTLIQMVTEDALTKLDIIRTYVDNGFVHTAIPVETIRVYAYLTEYIRAIERIAYVFGKLIDLLEEIGLEPGRAHRAHIKLCDVSTDLTEINNLLGEQLDIASL